MTKQRLAGKYAPDKNGKLKPVFNFTGGTNKPLVSASCRNNGPFTNTGVVSWYKKIWCWVKQNIP